MAEVFNTSLKFIAQSYIKLLNLKISSLSIEREIESNPYYPSLLSLTESFNRYNISNEAYEVEKHLFNQAEAPFVAYIKTPENGNDFILVIENTTEHVKYIYKNKKIIQSTSEKFLRTYQGIIWMAEANEEVEEDNYYAKLKKEKINRAKKNLSVFGVIGLIILLVSSNLTQKDLIPFITLLIFKIAGIACTVLLLVYEIDKNNVVVKNICSAGKQTSCDAVLGSKAAKIFGISFGEIGFFYFSATTLYLIMPGIVFFEKMMYLSLLSLFAAVYILFSLYYQWRVVKKWCTLCLTVQAVLLLEFAWGLFVYFNYSINLPDISWQSFSIILFCVLSPIVTWYMMKPFLSKAKDYDYYFPAYKRIRYNPDIFNTLLKQQPTAGDNWQKLGIDIGNISAENIIIKICNPYCGPCAKAHVILEEIVTHNNNVRLKIIFNAKNNEQDRGSRVVKHLLALYSNTDQVFFRKALDEWYSAEIKDYDLFAKKYPVELSEFAEQGQKLDAMDNWCVETGITFTPTIFVNGYRVPENYSVEELKNIL